jgi:hypothetical protein
MPKGVSRNPRSDKRRKKNRIPKSGSTSKFVVAKPDYLEIVSPPLTLLQAMESVREMTGMDTVNHPAHYTAGGIETIDFIEAKQLNYHLGQVIKYVTRAEHKNNSLEDLKKAQWYLNREIKNRSAE